MAKEKHIAQMDCHDSACRGIQIVLGARLETMCALRNRALKWNDPEGVHDMRVASRRLRSAIADFKPYLRKRSMPLSPLKAIARSLGTVRDEDVILIALETLLSKSGAEVAQGIKAIIREHLGRRVQARTKLKRTIKPSAIAEFRANFLQRLGSATTPIRSARGKDAHQALTFGQLGALIIGDRLQQLRDAGDFIYRPLEARKLHKLRILAKRLRYAIELFAPCWGGELKKSANEIARFQTSLGELHDCDIWISNLHARLEKPSGPAKDRRQNIEAAVWLLHHFVSERTKHYGHALARWQKWEHEGFLDRLKISLNADFTPATKNDAANHSAAPDHG